MIQCWHHNASQRPDMITVREKFDRLLEKQNPSTVLQQVVNAVSQIDSNENPSTNQDQLIPLHHFSTCLGQFQEPTESSNVYDTLHKLSPSTHSEFHYGFMAESQPKAVQISDERRLVETYMKCVENHRYEEADAVKHLLVKMIESQGEVSPEQMVAFADKHRLEGSFMQAMLIYQISLDFYDKYSHLDGSAEGVMGCVGGLHLTGMGLLEDPRWFEFFKNKRIVRDFVIPLMSNARRRILNLSHVSAESRCLCEAWCLHYIECAQNRIGDNRAREETLNLAVVLLRKVFGDDAAKYQVYGHLLNNYGFVCTANSRIGDALTFYLKAVEAYSMAEDLTPEEKKERVERSTKNLQEVASQR
uniref:Uncharacterized protein LOC108949854 n=1 Tax=Phallusia mammillata TaxID=59560 RepID=A0A6F9DIJ1_9ASCI|nr:uncharacterized protein LOC108949854 [Phallusia mammillata]